jgi:hypothetical protein
MEDMQKRSNCTSLLSIHSEYKLNLGTLRVDIVTASELERLKKRFMKLDRLVHRVHTSLAENVWNRCSILI